MTTQRVQDSRIAATRSSTPSSPSGTLDFRSGVYRDWHLARAELWARRQIVCSVVAASAVAADAVLWVVSPHRAAAGVLAGAGLAVAVWTLLAPGTRARRHLNASERWDALARSASQAAAAHRSLGLREQALLKASPPLRSRRRLLDVVAGRTHGPLSWLALAASVIALGAGTAMAASGDVVGGDDGGVPIPQPPPPPASDIARDLSPILVFAKGEQFVPLDRTRFVSTANLLRVIRKQKLTIPGFNRTEAGLPDDAKAFCQKQEKCALYLDLVPLVIRDGPKCYRYLQDRLLLEGADRPTIPPSHLGLRHCKGRRSPLTLAIAHPSVYWNVVSKGGFTYAEYWFLYVYNGFYNEHEGDWEEIVVRADANGTHPNTAFYSSHDRGQTRAWAAVRNQDGHAIVFVARGSHANYFEPGPQPFTLCKHIKGRKRCLKLVNDDADGCGGRLRPEGLPARPNLDGARCGHVPDVRVTYDLRPFESPSFDGWYGYGNRFVHGFFAFTDQSVAREPQRRPDWSDPQQLFTAGHT